VFLNLEIKMKEITKKLLLGLLISIFCITYVQSEPKMHKDEKGRWVNSKGGNIYGDSRFNLDADPRFNMNADPRFNLDADPKFNLDE
jgi:hypothetical protein